MANHKPAAFALLSALRSISPAEASSTPARQTRKPKPGARAGSHMIVGHFPDATLTALKQLMPEDGTTCQSLLDEAIHDRLVKKGRVGATAGPV